MEKIPESTDITADEVLDFMLPVCGCFDTVQRQQARDLLAGLDAMKRGEGVGDE